MKHSLAALAALAVLAALPAQAARQKVAVLDVRAVQGVQPGTATILTAIIAGDTSRAGYDVLSQADIGALIGFEKQKKMLGCGDDSSCLAEIGGALGAEYVMATQVGQIGSRFHLSLQVIDARKGNVLSRVSTFSERTEDALAETAQRAVAEALAATKERSPAPAAKAPAPSPAKVPAVATATPAATPTPTPTATPARPERSAAASPSNGGAESKGAATDGDSFFSRHPAFLELRGSIGNAEIPSPQVRDGGTGPGLELRTGLRWTPDWSFELGLGAQNLYEAKGEGSYMEFAFQTQHKTVTRGDIKTRIVLGVARRLATIRTVQLGAALDAGLALVRIEHEVLRFSGGSVQSKYEELSPRFGGELRADYPIRAFAIGLRLGAEFIQVDKEQFSRIDPSFGGETKWLEKGWLSNGSVTLAASYRF